MDIFLTTDVNAALSPGVIVRYVIINGQVVVGSGGAGHVVVKPRTDVLVQQYSVLNLMVVNPLLDATKTLIEFF